MWLSFHDVCKSDHYAVHLKLINAVCHLYLNETGRKKILSWPSCPPPVSLLHSTFPLKRKFISIASTHLHPISPPTHSNRSSLPITWPPGTYIALGKVTNNPHVSKFNCHFSVFILLDDICQSWPVHLSWSIFLLVFSDSHKLYHSLYCIT